MLPIHPYSLTFHWLQAASSKEEELSAAINDCSEQILSQTNKVEALLQRGIYYTAIGKKDLATSDFNALDSLIRDWRLIWPAYACRGYLAEPSPEKALFYYEKLFCLFCKKPSSDSEELQFPIDDLITPSSCQSPDFFAELEGRINTVLQRAFIHLEIDLSPLAFRKWVAHPLLQAAINNRVDSLSS